jgi:hypothetical protein
MNFGVISSDSLCDGKMGVPKIDSRGALLSDSSIVMGVKRTSDSHTFGETKENILTWHD